MVAGDAGTTTACGARRNADELAELDGLPAAGTWHLRGRELRLTNLDKTLAPGRDGEPPVTKRELIRYYARIAPLLLPYLAGRPAPGAPVSVPITWDELDDDSLRPDRWTVRDVLERVRATGDPLAPLIGRAQSLPEL